MDDSIRAVEKILNYEFKDKKLIEDALTHSSYAFSDSYQRLEFLGDAAISLAMTNFLFTKYPKLDQGKLSFIRSANISTEKLARVSVRHELYRYVRHNDVSINDKVRDFVYAVEEEEGFVVYGGLVKAPKVLADIVESVAAAVYIDLQFDLLAFWMVFRDIMEPIFTYDIIQNQPQPVMQLLELCQKYGNQLEFRNSKENGMIIVSVYIDDDFVASSSSLQRDTAKLHAAKIALENLGDYSRCNNKELNAYKVIDGTNEIAGAKQKLHEICSKKKWHNPVYRVEEEIKPSKGRRYMCSVKINIREKLVSKIGEHKTRIKDAENSAASLMIQSLHEDGRI
ncbi:ribonuclease 3-like protein 2 [Impatiens glandulifera]|uniref:ribonuclease 3-like protein 2 n=1 Tax=Impatiens glandulifera TaxID=253017 RepID=UPI001FB06028|nr:ribonuclease 3-like protein 2 [Impatiens glandulifera]